MSNEIDCAYKRGDQCAKGLPGTKCEPVGCVAHITVAHKKAVDEAMKEVECDDVLREEKQKCLAEIRKVKDPYAAALIGDKDFTVTHGEVGYWNQVGLSIRLHKPCEKLGLKEGKRYKVILVEETDKRCHACRRYDEHGDYCTLDDLAPCKFVPKI